MKTTKILATLALAAGLVLGTATSTSAEPIKVQPVAAKVTTLPTRVCADDHDDRNCYWDGAGPAYIVDRSNNVTYLNPKLNDPAKRAAWVKTNKAAHREYWGTVWGHRLCWAKVGDTSYVYCFDGHRETS
ncbi:hypothetical protein [Streptomyces sp. NPDC046805]|uniref:hypothetical protein n=1 Tax=Streptomyces sp. NPDC046805 TaxID=3155134 RepID=UPI0033F4A189